MIYGFRNLRFPVSIRRQSVKIRRSGITIRKLGTAFGFSLAVSLQCVVLPTQFETVRRLAVEQTCEIPLNHVFLLCTDSHPTTVYNLVDTCRVCLNIHPFGQGNQCFSAFGLCGQRCHAPRCRHHADSKNVFLHPYLILNLKTMRQKYESCASHLSPICFGKPYICANTPQDIEILKDISIFGPS